MKTHRYATSRQKACQPCSAAKAKCDRRAGTCGRCALRGLSCIYPQSSAPGTSMHNIDPTNGTEKGNQTPTSGTFPFNAILQGSDVEGRHMSTTLDGSTRSAIGQSPSSIASTTVTNPSRPSDPVTHAAARMYTEAPADLEFSNLELICPIDVHGISIRWMNPYIPVPGQTIKTYPPATIAFVHRILKSYTSIVVRGRGLPPFVHATQMATASTPPIATCLSLVRLCDRSLPRGSDVAADIIIREMDNLYQQHEAYEDMASLAAFQAYLIYAMVLFFQLNKGTDMFPRRTIMALQDIACSSSRRGLLCPAEQQRTRPKWEAWIVAEAKRRTLFTMYLFGSVLSAQDDLPTFLGTELRGLPAPSSRSLWQASSHDWVLAFNVHLVDWVDGDLSIDELWPIQTDFDEAAIVERRRRVDQWLENIDEFGTVIYAVTSTTHGD